MSATTWSEISLEGGGARLHAFAREGSGDPVVVLHGAGANALAMTPVAPAFGERPVLLLDLPGHGRSEATRDWTLETTVEVVADATARRFGDAPAIWCGHSWGGKVAGLLAARHRERCRALVLLDPSPSAAVPVDTTAFVDENWTTELCGHRTLDEAVAAARGLPQWEPWSEETARAVAHGLAQREDGQWALRPSREDLVALCTAVLHADATAALVANAGLPVLLVVAAESRPWQDMTNVVTYAGADVAEVAGHHWVHRCSTDAVVTRVRKWLQGGSGTRRPVPR